MLKLKKSRFPIRTVKRVIILALLVICSLIILFSGVIKRMGYKFAFVEGTPYEPPTQVIIKEIVPDDMIININTATIEELITLDGIGEVTAQKIIEYREKNNGFLTIDELTKVDGIGEGKLDKIRNRITTG